MATLALGAAGAAVGSALLPTGFSVLGATLSGAAIGQAAGAIAGSYIDQALFGSSGQSRIVEGARLKDLQVLASSEGAPILRLYGRARIAGQIIWATNFEEEIVTTTQGQGGGGGKGLGGGAGGGSQQSVTTREYRYFANFAVGLCEGEITRVGRVWADGKELNLSDYTYRVYRGSENQMPDSLIETKEGVGLAPAYRGLAYIVFERMPIERFGNRLPQLNFEVFRAVDEFEQTIRGVTILPGSGEFVYEREEVTRSGGVGVTLSENVNTRRGASDWDVAIDDLEDSLPGVKSASLIVSWFGSDLRASECLVQPGVDRREKLTSPHSWSVSGQSREQAYLVSSFEGSPAFGGTPSDSSVVSAIKNLKSRGFRVLFYPFLMMDIPQGNILPDPWTGEAGQPPYPWRGRISVDPAPGESGSPDKSAVAAGQVQEFVGSAQISDFSISGETVFYSGSEEWSWRRMVLHYAHICKAAGGVDGFLIGSELRGLTTVRESENRYPFVAALVQLASDVKSILGADTDLSYAADWSEYFGHQPRDGSNDVYFHLDPLWSSQDIDAVAIDCYWPLSDWRDGDNHLDYQSGVRSIYDLDYLKSNIAGGEGYHWFYQDQEQRDNQVRTSITDGHGKPWVFRYKDIKNWWRNLHFDRPAGAEAALPTGWIPESKPIWFTETGCPAIDKGSNQPNLFFDPKSSESAIPYFSKGVRDDLIQRLYLQALYEFFDTDHDDYVEDSNPVSSQYSGRMVDLENVYAYSWDARPYPAFPLNSQVWSDGINWNFGHWLTGRVGDATLAQTVAAIVHDYDFDKVDVSGLRGVMGGYVIDHIMSARAALQQLELSFFFDSFESDGVIRFEHRGQLGSVAEVGLEQLADDGNDRELYQIVRGQETDLPAVAKIKYIESSGGYRQAVVESRRLAGSSNRTSQADVPIVLNQEQAQTIADIRLQDAWASREHVTLSLPPSRLALEASDIIRFRTQGRDHLLRITEIADRGSREIASLTIEPSIYERGTAPNRTAPLSSPIVFGPAIGVLMDLPLLRGDETPHAGYIAAYQSPWPGSVSFYRSPEDSGFNLKTLATVPAKVGRTVVDFPSGPLGRWDRASTLKVQMDNGSLLSATELSVFDGTNSAAVQNDFGDWEIIQFKSAELVGAGTYDLSELLRGQAGTEGAMHVPVSSGARFVLLDSAISQVDMTADEIGIEYNWLYGPSNRDFGHSSYLGVTKSFSGLGLKPYSPVHIRASRVGQDIVIEWIRRTRLGGDNWDVTEVPLAEEFEAYEIDIFDGESVVRSIATSTPTALYPVSDQLEDFGEIPSLLEIEVYQTASGYGRGAANRSRLVL